MQRALIAVSFAAAIGLACGQSAAAVPAAATAVKEAARAGSVVQKAQYYERHTRHGVVKCYRDFVVGPYRCHYYRGPF